MIPTRDKNENKSINVDRAEKEKKNEVWKKSPQVFFCKANDFILSMGEITCLLVSNPQQRRHGPENRHLITEQRFSAGINTCLLHQ